MRTAGSVALTCDAVDGRTRLRSVRCEGLSRSSRALRAPGGAIRLLLSTLGPGVLAGDGFTLTGTVRERASLLACGQMATPVFAGAQPSSGAARWHVADGATLLVASEPLLLEAGSCFRSAAAYEVEGSGRACIVDTLALRGAARLSMRTSVLLDGRLTVRDALDVSAAGAAYGSVVFVAAAAAERAAFATRALAVTAQAAGVRAGCGETSSAVIVRLHGARVWDVRAAALEIAAQIERRP